MFTALDITSRKQSEKQLIDSERNYREIFDAVNDVVMIHDKTSGEIVDVNSKVTDLYGYEPSELYGMTVESMSQGEPPFTMVEAAEWIKKTVEEGPQVSNGWAVIKRERILGGSQLKKRLDRRQGSIARCYQGYPSTKSR